MTFPAGSPFQDFFLLETTYQIGRFIQSFVTEEVGDRSEKPWSNYSSNFRSGPNPFYDQTKEGLVLEAYYGMPSRIHTPCGSWHILGSGSGNWKKVFEAIKEPLGLELIKEGKQTEVGYIGPYWAITKWNELKIDKPVYRDLSQYIPYEKVKEVWNEFVIKKNFSLLALTQEELNNLGNDIFVLGR